MTSIGEVDIMKKALEFHEMIDYLKNNKNISFNKINEKKQQTFYNDMATLM